MTTINISKYIYLGRDNETRYCDFLRQSLTNLFNVI